MNTNIPRVLGLLEGLLVAIKVTEGKINIDNIKSVVEKSIGYLYEEAPHLKPENNETKHPPDSN